MALDDSITIEYYTRALPRDIVVFVKREARANFVANYTTTLTVEKDMLSIGAIEHKGRDDQKTTTKRSQSSSHKFGDKYKDPFDFKSITKSLKLLTNEVSDLKRKNNEPTLVAKT